MAIYNDKKRVSCINSCSIILPHGIKAVSLCQQKTIRSPAQDGKLCTMIMKSFIVVDEFGSNISSIVDIVVKDGSLHVMNEFGCDITRIVELKKI